MKKKKISEDTIEHVKVIGVIAVFYLIMEGMGITCPIKFITGISCAGCGMSRAWIALLHLDLAKAFYYHPLFWVPPIALLIIWKKDTIPSRIYKCLLFTIIGAFGIVYVYRMVAATGDIVVFQPVKGILPRILRYIFY